MARADEGTGVLRRAVAGLARGLSYVFGRPAWDAPPWARELGRASRRGWRWATADRAKGLALLASMVLAIGGGSLALRWWKHRPRPVTVTATVIAPEATRIEDKVRPRPLRIEFADSVAPLDKIGKVVTAGVALETKTNGLLGGLARGAVGAGAAAGVPEGIWRWVSDRELTYSPKADWPVGQPLIIRLARKGLVAPHVRLSEYDLPFTTAEFQARLASVEFYQDPVNPNLKKVVATIQFTHPVDTATFDKRVSLRLVPSDKEDAPSDYQAQITYDRLKGTAFVHSTPLNIPRHDATFFVTVRPGTRAARGGPADERELKDQVVVPGLFNLLKVTAVNLSLVDNERYEPEQALIVETSVGVAGKDVAKALRATLLPDRTSDDKPANWSSASSIGPDELKRGTAVGLQAVASETEFPVSHGFKLKVPVGRQVYVEVTKGLRAFGGYVLGESFQTIVDVMPYPAMLRILQSGALLATSGDRKVPVLARDVPAIKYEIGRVLPAQIQHLVTQSTGDFARPGWSYRFDESNLAEVFEETHRMKNEPGRPEYDALDLSKYIGAGSTGGGGERRGLFLLRAQSWNPETKELLGQADSRLVLVSDLGVLVKENGDGSHELFVESIHSGQPVAGARVEVLGKNGQRVLEGTTDSDGHAHIATFKDLHREKEPALYLVSTAKDQSFLPVNRGDRQLDTSRFDVGGVSEEPSSGAAKGLTAYLFSDRGIYRPGDEIRVGMIIKSKDWSARLAGLPLQVVINDARGLTVKDQRLKLGSAGFEEIRHATPEIAPTGTYSVNVYVVRDGHPDGLLGSTTVTVREFLPDRMKISAALSRENPQGWVAPGELKARVTLANLFGTPAVGRQVRAKLTLSPWVPAFSHPRLRDYRFFDPLRPREGVSETLADVKTDDQGTAEIDLGLQRFATATYRLTVTVDGYEAEGGRSVTADAGALVSPLPFLIGYKADGDLAYMTRDADRQVELLAVAPTGAPTKVSGLRAVLVERKYVSVLVRQDKGTYRYQSVKKDLELSSKPLAIGAEGGKRKLATDRPGDFTLVIRDAKDQDLQRIDYSVTGYGNLSREVEKNAELQIALRHPDVALGEELEMQIKAPYTGVGLITVERDRVYAWKWFKAETTATVQHIRVPPELEGGGYVSVAFVRDPASEEVFMSPLSHGIAPFSISRVRRQVKVQLETADLARPGAPLHIKVKTDKPAKVLVFAVDEGILRVASYKTPDPLGYFFQKRALSVKTTQILDLILPEFQRLLGAAAPGGDDDVAVGANLNPFRRRQQQPVAFWSGIIEPGPQERDVVYDVPDSFNGTLRVMAVAVAPDALGAAERRTLVRGDFVISPNVPTFLAPGDESAVSVTVANNVVSSGKDAPITLTVAASAGVEILEGGERKLNITALREGTTTFKVRARAAVGPATLTFTARGPGNAQAHLVSTLSVRPAVPFLASFQAGHLRDGAVTVPLRRQLYKELRQVEAGLSALPLGLTHGLRGYLEKFPHGCTEQIVSQAVPALALSSHAEFGYAPRTAAAAVERWIQMLRARQTEAGSFGRWAANPDVDKLASVWAAHMLLEAREKGFAVPPEMLKATTGYLQDVAATDVEGLVEGGVRAYATYVLTRMGTMTGPFAAAQEKHLQANHPKEWRQELAGLYLAATYKLLKQDGAAREILKSARFGQPRTADTEWYHDRLAHDAQALYLVARHFPERAAQLTPAEIDAIVDPIFRGTYNTYSSAWSILGLEAYGQLAAAAGNSGQGGGGGAPPLSVRELVGGQPRLLTLPASLLPAAAVSATATAVRFEAGGSFGAYWVLAEGGFDQIIPDKPAGHELEIVRSYETADGKPVSTVKLGEEITVVVRLRTVGRDDVKHLAVVDLLPGGFEPVIQSKAPPAHSVAGDDQAAAGESEPAAEEGEGEGGEEGPQGEGESEDEGQAAAGSLERRDGAPFALTIALPGATLPLEFGDVREDRVVLYAPASREAKEIRYVIKATNVGNYAVAPVQAAALYDNTIYARGSGGGKVAVVAR